MKTPPPAGELLTAWLREHDKSQEWLVDQIKVTREALWRWVNGERTPRVEHCVAIEQLTGIPVHKWIAEADTVKGAA